MSASDFGSRSDRARTPSKGIRVRLRTALRNAGIVDKFRTDEARDGTLLIIVNNPITLPFVEFEGRTIREVIRS